MLYLKASPLQMGFLSGAGAAAVLIFGLFAGAWVDRLRRRPILIDRSAGPGSTASAAHRRHRSSTFGELAGLLPGAPIAPAPTRRGGNNDMSTIAERN